MHALRPLLGALALSAIGCCASLAGPEAADDTVGPVSDTAAAVQVLVDCSLAQPGADVGLEQLRAACPALEQALLTLQLPEQLGADWRDTINVATLVDLASLAQRYQGDPAGIQPRPAALSAVMQSLRVSPLPGTWWQRFKAWLRSLLQRPSQQRSSWLTQLHLPWKPSLGLLRLIDYLLIGIVLLLAAWIVWREVRAARALSPVPRVSRRRRERAVAPGLREPGAELPDLQAMPPAQRAGAVLLALIGVLRRSGRLERERALTHRQLAARVRFDDGVQRARFERLALLAERCLYGRPEPIDAELLADAVALHRQLSSSAGVRA